MIDFQLTFDPAINVKDIRTKLLEHFPLKTLSVNTIYNYMNKVGKFVLPKESSILDQEKKSKRLLHCMKLSNLSSIDNIIFSDESMIVLRRNKCKVFQIRGTKSIKRYHLKNIKIMVWGAISMKGKVHLHVVGPKDTVTGDYYCKNILESFIEKANEIYPKKWIFMQDNARPHKAHNTLDFLKERDVELLDHPPYSPDLNPIETVWGLLKRKVEKLNPQNYWDLRIAIENSWKTIDNESIKNIIQHLKTTVNQVIKARGNNVFTTNKRNRPKINYNENNLEDKNIKIIKPIIQIVAELDQDMYSLKDAVI